jgi:hypothetical protein
MTVEDVTRERVGSGPAEAGVPVWRHPLLSLGLVSVAYTIILLLVSGTRSPLTWDEAIYVSHFARGMPAGIYSPHRSIGTALLVAPITAVTDSLSSLRIYLAVLSGAGLFCGYWPWLKIHRSHAVSLAALLFAGLWLSIYYGERAMPNLYIAICMLAAVALFCQATLPRPTSPHPGPRVRWWPLTGLALVFTAMTLLRQVDAGLAAATLLAAAPVIFWRTRHHRPGVPITTIAGAITAIMIGLAAGWGQWLAEAYTSFGGPAARLRATSTMNGTGLHLSFLRQLHALSGSLDCKPTQNCGPITPLATTWWSATAALVIITLLTATHRRRLRTGYLLTVTTALVVAIPYLLLTSYTAPRYLLPSYALLSLPAAAALTLTLTTIHTRTRTRRLPLRALALTTPLTLTATAITLDITGQLTVLHHMANNTYNGPITDQTIAARLTALGIHRPCLISGARAATVAYQLKCQNWDLNYRLYTGPQLTQRLTNAATTGQTIAVLSIGPPTPTYTTPWTLHPLWHDHTWYVQIHPPGRQSR